MQKLFQAKSIDEMLATQHDLKRTLRAKDLVFLGIGAIIGAGIFVITGVAAAKYAGPSIMLSFVLAGFACGLAALCYSELTAMIPISGSAYSYAYATMGEVIAWIIGWDLVLEYAMAASTVAIGWSGYLASLLGGLGIRLPKLLTSSMFMGEGGFINLPAVLVVSALTYLLITGIRESARANNVMVIIKISMVVLFILAGMGSIHPSNWTPFMPFGFSGMMTGAGVIFFAYIGFDAVSTAAQEAIDPEVNLPRGIIISLAVCTVLYLLTAAVLTGMISYTELNVPAPIAKALHSIGQGDLAFIIEIGALVGMTSVILVLLLGQSRVFYAMGRDGLLPPWAADIHPEYKTPHTSTLVVGVGVATVAALVPLNVLSELVSLGTLFSFGVVCGGVLLLRRSRPELPRPFHCPGVPYVPIAGMLACFYLMVNLPFRTWLLFIVWMGIGLTIYSRYGMKYSELRKTGDGTTS
ncbi:MAG: amino acid permease [Methylococcaceae bacterium]|nr:MAG: amino acid permease [Methylococcaceae bacterium]